MNTNFDGGCAMCGLVPLIALAELGRLLNKPGRRQGGSWKRVVLAVIATPVALLLLAGVLGS